MSLSRSSRTNDPKSPANAIWRAHIHLINYGHYPTCNIYVMQCLLRAHQFDVPNKTTFVNYVCHTSKSIQCTHMNDKIDGLVQEIRNPIDNALELRLYCFLALTHRNINKSSHFFHFRNCQLHPIHSSWTLYLVLRRHI